MRLIVGQHPSFHFNSFLDASSHLYNRLCPSVGWLVGRLVGRSGNAFIEITESRVLRYAIAPLTSSLFCFQWKRRFSQIDQSRVENETRVPLLKYLQLSFCSQKDNYHNDKSSMREKPINYQWFFAFCWINLIVVSPNRLRPSVTWVTHLLTRPNTRPIPVADGWAGAEMRLFTLFDSCSRTNRPTDGRTKALIELRVRN